MTAFSAVTFKLTLDTVFTRALLRQIKQVGFSRVPVIESASNVIGILLAKSCLGVDFNQQKTLRELYRERQIDIRVPLYLPQTCSLARVVKLFQDGHTHMAVVCRDASQAQASRDYADRIHNGIR